MFGHWAQILLLLVIGLLVFGPKRVVEMGSSLGKAFRELRESTRGMSWSSLTEADDEPERGAALSATDTSVSKLTQFTAAANASIETPPVVEATAETSEESVVVEDHAKAERVEDTANL